jgi:hypothetical protein
MLLIGLETSQIRIVRSHLSQIAVVTDVITDVITNAILVDVAPLHCAPCGVFSHPECLNDRAGVVLTAAPTIRRHCRAKKRATSDPIRPQEPVTSAEFFMVVPH